jgi:alkylhydroperoxidase/carboxymuconolactone decarboxylase family protein YurZ
MANNPELLLAWWNFRNHVVGGGKLQQRHRELIILRVAVHMKCWYEWASHVDRGLQSGLSLDEIECVRFGRIASCWNQGDELVLRATDEFFDKQEITPETRIAMRACFTPAELMDLIAICGAYVTLGAMINTWGIELDEFISMPDSAGDKTLLRA